MKKPKSNANGKHDRFVYVPRVVVKIKDFIQISEEDDVMEFFCTQKVRQWDQLAETFPGIKFQPLFGETKAETLQELVRKATERDNTYRPPNFFNFYAVECHEGIDPQALVTKLSELDHVETAYQEGGPTPPPFVNAANDPRSVDQGYLDPAPDGIDAEYAWPIVGGDGAGQGFVDLERGWTLNHEDLAAAGVTLISGLNQDFFGHGTSVLGEVVAVDNTIGGVGIAPQASARVVSQWRPGGSYNTAQAILDAIAVMNFGDVLLLEAQTSAMGVSLVPVEVELATYAAIRLGTALGIVIVEAAGNGGNDLDTYPGQILDRSSAKFRDSGAIMVGAASSATPHTRLGFSNFGNRIDCYAWGENIDTTGDGWNGNLTTTYTSSFGGTSGASPIITGAALLIQGMAEANFGFRFSPLQIRAILSNPATGTPTGNPPVDRIGVMPNLRNIIDNVLNITPDIYLRDFVGDSGDPHAGPISASPDIILSQTSVANPQAAFGEGSGTENNASLGFEAEAGQDNYIYVRVRNRGGAPAANVDATVYWSEVATLITPNLWNLVGTTNIPNVPNGNILTVGDAITWSAGDIPGTGHYCFVGLIGNAQDPAPNSADFMNFDNFRTFIKNNNNVTWRNFNVVNNVPPPGISPRGFVQLPFLLTGAPDKARPFAFDIVGELPQGAKIMIEMPMYLAEKFCEKTPYIKRIQERETAIIPLQPFGKNRLGEALLPVQLKAKCRLLVAIPEEHRKREYEVAIRQIYERDIVGDITWRLSPKKEESKEQYKEKKAK